MLAVSNTSPISNLASIGRLELLKAQFSTVWIPDAAANELAVHPDPAARDAIQAAIRDKWVRVQTTKMSRLRLFCPADRSDRIWGTGQNEPQSLE